MERDKSDEGLQELDVTALSFLNIDIERHLAQAIAYRKDAWLMSFGSLDGYSETETAKWLSANKDKGVKLYHLWSEEEIIGQLEYKDNIITSDQRRAGYVYLLYLKKAYRGKGIGQFMHDFVIQKLLKANCVGAMLKYVPGNKRAENLYIKNGWYKTSITTDKKLQQMRKDL